MILVDSCVIIESLGKSGRHRFTSELRARFAISPVIRMEVLAGAKDQQAYAAWSKLLALHPSLPITEEVWSLAIPMGFGLKARGITVSFQDILIAANAIVSDCRLWTYDRDFERIQTHWPELLLYCGPEVPQSD